MSRQVAAVVLDREQVPQPVRLGEQPEIDLLDGVPRVGEPAGRGVERLVHDGSGATTPGSRSSPTRRAAGAGHAGGPGPRTGRARSGPPGVERDPQVRDRPGHRPVDRHELPGDAVRATRLGRQPRDDARRRAQPGDAAGVRRVADRAAVVVALGQRDHAGRHRRRRRRRWSRPACGRGATGCACGRAGRCRRTSAWRTPGCSCARGRSRLRRAAARSRSRRAWRSAPPTRARRSSSRGRPRPCSP